MHEVIPALEYIASRWEAKLEKDRFQLFHDALRAGLDKLIKYYKKLDNARVYILSQCKSDTTFARIGRMLTHDQDLHPYYKLAYITEKWGGHDEYLADVAAGEPNARNWQVYAREVIEKAVSARDQSRLSIQILMNDFLMQLTGYWPKRLRVTVANKAGTKKTATVARVASIASSTNNTAGHASRTTMDDEDDDDDYDRQRRRHLESAEQDDGWRTEMRRYEDDPALDVDKDTNIVEWWQVRSPSSYPHSVHTLTCLCSSGSLTTVSYACPDGTGCPPSCWRHGRR